MKAKSVINVKDISLKYANKVVLNNINFSIHENDRIGIIGRNGSGKSSLLKIIAGIYKPDDGVVAVKNGLKISYLAQDFVLDQCKTIKENIFSSLKFISDKLDLYYSLPVDSNKKNKLENEIEVLDGWNLDLKMNKALSSLHLFDEDRKVETLSGGEMRRVALCKALIVNPDILILDEPTNHMDTESIEWLENYLKGYSGGLLMVTHDRYFLDRVISKIVEIKNGELYSYPGNYTEFMILKARHESGLLEVEKKRQSFLRREIEWIRKSPKARTTKSRSRIDKYYDTLQNVPASKDQDLELVIPPPSKLSTKVLALKNISMKYKDQSLFENVNFNFEKHTKLGIIGANGTGKTTLLKIILGDLMPQTGKVVVGVNTKFNYIDQKRVLLDEQKTPLAEISQGNSFVAFGDHKISVRAYLKRFLFSDQDIDSPIWRFSGGEKSRLILAKILKNGGNFLILDEPTNDLDISTLRILEDTLNDFGGVVVIVSHDRYFLNRVCNGILAFEDKKLVYHEGNYDYYFEKRGAVQTKIAAKSKKTAFIKKNRPEIKIKKLSYLEKKELEEMPEILAAAEQKVQEMEKMFSDPDFYDKHGNNQTSFIKDFNLAKEKVTNLYHRWEQLEELNA